MNKIDILVKTLFYKLLSNKSAYKGKDAYGGLCFNLDGTSIRIRWFRAHKDDTFTNNPITIEHFKYDMSPGWISCPCSSDNGFIFVMEINGLRQLKVPKLTRLEEAEILTKIEELANWHEKYILENLINFDK